MQLENILGLIESKSSIYACLRLPMSNAKK